MKMSKILVWLPVALLAIGAIWYLVEKNRQQVVTPGTGSNGSSKANS